MTKSFIAKSPVNFVEFNFRINVGDILLHDSANQRLTVYRSGEIIKVVKQTALGVGALVKNGFISETTNATPAAPPVVKSKPEVKPEIKVEKVNPVVRKPVPERKKPEESVEPLKEGNKAEAAKAAAQPLSVKDESI